MFATVTTTMGYDATWGAETARVLFAGPTEKEKLKSADFDPDKLEMEYKAGDFEGLKQLADDNEMPVITIATIGEFTVKSVAKKFDGKTFVARLQAV